MRATVALVSVAVIFGICAAPAECQAPASPVTPVPEASGIPDRFRIDVGGFVMSASSVLTLNAPTATTNVDFEKDLTLPTSGTRVWFDVSWRLAGRHQFDINYTKMGRTGTFTNLARNLTWGDYVFTPTPTANTNCTSSSTTLSTTTCETQGTASFSYLAAQYRFAVIKNNDFEVGPLVGGGYLDLTTSIIGPATKSAADTGTATVDAQTKQLGFDFGGYFAARFASKVQLRGDFAYMKFSPNSLSASLMDGKATLTFFPWKNIGFGGGYKYNKFSYDRGLLATKLGGDLSYHGAVIEASFVF